MTGVRQCALGALSAMASLASCAGGGSALAPASGFDGCRAYRDQAAAQRAWERAGRPGGADGDGDGRVCEALDDAPDRDGRSGCRRTRRVVVVAISARRYPYTADHIVDSIAAGHPRVLHLDRAGADANREKSLEGIPTRDSYDREEYPPAVAAEGGAGADVRYVPSADNRGAGAVLGVQLAPFCDGQRFRIRVTGRVAR
jgi:hypothetical protein